MPKFLIAGAALLSAPLMAQPAPPQPAPAETPPAAPVQADNSTRPAEATARRDGVQTAAHQEVHPPQEPQRRRRPRRLCANASRC